MERSCCRARTNTQRAGKGGASSSGALHALPARTVVDAAVGVLHVRVAVAAAMVVLHAAVLIVRGAVVLWEGRMQRAREEDVIIHQQGLRLQHAARSGVERRSARRRDEWRQLRAQGDRERRAPGRCQTAPVLCNFQTRRRGSRPWLLLATARRARWCALPLLLLLLLWVLLPPQHRASQSAQGLADG